MGGKKGWKLEFAADAGTKKRPDETVHFVPDCCLLLPELGREIASFPNLSQELQLCNQLFDSGFLQENHLEFNIIAFS